MLTFTIIASVVVLIMLLGLFRNVSVDAEIEIDAPAETVWEVLTGFSDYGEWNPFIIKASGEFKAGTVMDVAIAVPVIRSMDFKLKTVSIDEGKAFVWLGTTIKPKILDGLHTFNVESLEDGRTRFSQEEKLSGLLLYFAVPFIKSQMQNNFNAMNAALKTYAEQMSLQAKGDA
ncbi:MAG: SRPBCC domain-containing protein [Nitrosomonas sp.]|nr:SRPBCC domain-containing protein [Nitrosomonas sp.]